MKIGHSRATRGGQAAWEEEEEDGKRSLFCGLSREIRAVVTTWKKEKRRCSGLWLGYLREEERGSS